MRNKIILFSDRTTEYFLYLLLFFVPFSQAGVEICFGFAFSAWIIKQVISHKSQVISYLPHTEINKPLLAFVLANAVAVVMSVNFKSSIRPFFSKVLEYVIIFFMVVDTINTKKRIKNLLAVVIFSTFFISVDAAVQYFRGVDLLRGYAGYGHQIRASFIGSNEFAGWLVMVIFVISGLLLSRQSGRVLLKRLGLGVLVLFLLICLGLTSSKGAWIGFLVGLIIFAEYKIIRISKRAKVLLILLIIVFAIGTLFILPYTLKEQIGYTGIIIERVDSYRPKLWQEALSIIEDFPLFGAGLNTYMAVSKQYSIPGGGRGGSYPHNCYLQMAAEIGLVGLACFLWLLVRWYKLVFHALKENRDSPLRGQSLDALKDNPRTGIVSNNRLWWLSLGLLAGISAFLIHSFFDTNLYSLQLVNLFWFMLGLAVSVQRIIV